jgi:hypothetical protein
MMFRAPCLKALRPTPPRATSLHPLLGRLLLLGLAASACTKEAPREPPPRAEEPAAAPAPKTSAPPPPAAPSVQPSELQLRQDESSGATDFGVGAGQAAPAKPATPSSAPAAKKGSSRAEAPRRAAPSPNARGATDAEKDDGASPEALRRELNRAVELSTPDCPSARERKQAICDLASQLCQLVDRDPDVASVESYCADARQRCSEAERRTAERCPR